MEANSINRSPLDEWIHAKHGIHVEDREAIIKWQIARLNKILSLAKTKSSFYREHLKGIQPICKISDMDKVPFTDAEVLRREGMRMLCVPPSEIERIVTLQTSGTTDHPKRLYFTLADQELTIDFFCHGMQTLTKPGETVCVCLPGELRGSVGDLLCKGIQRIPAKPILYGMIQNLHDAAVFISLNKTDVLVGVPVQILALAEYCKARQIKTNVKRVLLSTDYAARSLVTRIEAVFTCEVYDHLGMTEMGLGGAVDCEAHQGMHIRENDLYIEVIHPVTKHPVTDGTEGELVFTTLTREGMPMIRYRTGDYGVITHEKCACGSCLTRIVKMGARLGSSIEINGEQVTITQLDEVMFAQKGIIDYHVITGESGAPEIKPVYLSEYLETYGGKRRFFG